MLLQHFPVTILFAVWFAGNTPIHIFHAGEPVCAGVCTSLLEDFDMANEQASGLQGVRKWVAENKLRAVGAPHDLTLRALSAVAIARVFDIRLFSITLSNTR